jgi:arabinan endo-1,5-alpha-L-arabinosidase
LGALLIAGLAPALTGCSAAGDDPSPAPTSEVTGSGGNAGSGGTGSVPTENSSGSGGASGNVTVGVAGDPNIANTSAGSDSGQGGTGVIDSPDSGTPNNSDVIAPSGGTCGTSWQNPSKQGTHDPSVIKQGDTYYLFSTGRNVGFSTSKDKLTWARGGSAMGALPAWTNTLGLVGGAPDIWAPDVHQVGNKLYLYYAVSVWGDVTHSAVGLMTNTTLDPNAAGYQWVDQGKAIGSPEGGKGVNVIDPDLFVDDDGTWWLTYGSFHSGLRLIQLNPATGLALTNPPNPITLTTSLGEGSSLIKANGHYYLFASVGHCCDGLNSTYHVMYGRADKVTGPYLNRAGASINSAAETLLAAGQDGNPGQGGQSFFKEKGQWYIDYHAYQPPTGGSVLNIRPVYFDADDWPTFDICKAKGYKP